MRRGPFIVVEGIDGAGKTTQVKMLTAFLRGAGERVVNSKEPTDGPWGQVIRRSAATGRMSLADELEAFCNDRESHARELINPALSRGDIVILDRYFYSTSAYQGAYGGDAVAIDRMMHERFPIPDATFIIDVSPPVGLERIRHGRNEIPNAFEKEHSLHDARRIFLELAKTHANVTVIDGHLTADAVHHLLLTSLLGGALKSRLCEKEFGCDEPLICSAVLSNSCRWFNLSKAAASAAN